MNSIIEILFGRRQSKNKDLVTDQRSDILPDSVRYALAYKGAELKPSEVNLLVHNPAYRAAGIYLTAKLLDYDTGYLEQFILETAQAVLTHNSSPEEVASTYLAALPESMQVKGHKAGVLISRYGNEAVESKFASIASDSYSRGLVPLILMYAGFLGFEPFLRQLPPDSSLVLLLTERSTKSRSPEGYILTKDSSGMNIESNPINLLVGAEVQLCAVDDVINKGTTAKKVDELWKTDPNLPPIVDWKYVIAMG